MKRRAATVIMLAIGLLLTACTAPPATAPTSEPTPTDSAIVHVLADAVDETLRAELLGMLERDQAERLEGAQTEGDQARTDRLREIIAEYGWPGISLVGEDGDEAAWAIAQHSDLDPEFQAEAVVLLGAAVAANDASPGNLAYLTDRVAAGGGKPQTYGTQIACGDEGPVPATPIVDDESVDDRRMAAGLPPLEDYIAEMAEICAEEF